MLQQLKQQTPWGVRFECGDKGPPQSVCNQHNRYRSCVKKQSTKTSLRQQWELLTQLTLDQKGTGLNSSVHPPPKTEGTNTPYDDVLWKASTNAVSSKQPQCFQSPAEVTSEAFEACFDNQSGQFTFVPEDSDPFDVPSISGLSESPVFGKPSFPPPSPHENDLASSEQKLPELSPSEDPDAALVLAEQPAPFTVFSGSGNGGTRSVSLSDMRLCRNERRGTQAASHCCRPLSCNINSCDSETGSFDSEVISCSSQASSCASKSEGHRDDGVSHMDEGAVTFRNPKATASRCPSRAERTAFAAVMPEPARPVSLGSSDFPAQGGSDSSTRMAMPLFSGESLAGRPSGSSSSSSATRKKEHRRQEDQQRRRTVTSQTSSNGRAQNHRRGFSPHGVGHPRGSPASARSASVPTSGVGRVGERNGKDYNRNVGLEVYHGGSGYSPVIRKLQNDAEFSDGALVSIPEAMRVSRRCPCAQHSSRMERFARWYHEREVQRQMRREAARQRHALTLPEFREAFPLRAEDDVEDVSTEAGTASLLRGERVRKVYDECLQNWVPFTERHPELVRSVASLMRRHKDRKAGWRSGSLVSKSAPADSFPDERGKAVGQRPAVGAQRRAPVGPARSPRFALTPRSNKLENALHPRRPTAFGDGGEFSKWGPTQHALGQSGPGSRGVDRDYGAGEPSGIAGDEFQRHAFGSPYAAAESQGAVTGPGGFLRAATVHPEPPVVANPWTTAHYAGVPGVQTSRNAQPYRGCFWGSVGTFPGETWGSAAGPSQVHLRGRAKVWDSGSPSNAADHPVDQQIPDPRFHPPQRHSRFSFGPASVVNQHWPPASGAEWAPGAPASFVGPAFGYRDLRSRESGSDENRDVSVRARQGAFAEKRAPGAVQFRLDEADGVPDEKPRTQQPAGGRKALDGRLTPAASQTKRGERGERRGRAAEEPVRKASTGRRNVEPSKSALQKRSSSRKPLSSLWRSTYLTPSNTQASQPTRAGGLEQKGYAAATDKIGALQRTQKALYEDSRDKKESEVVRSAAGEVKSNAGQVVSPGKASSGPRSSLTKAPSFELSLIQDTSADSSARRPQEVCTTGVVGETENSIPTFGGRTSPSEVGQVPVSSRVRQCTAVPPRSETQSEEKPTSLLGAPSSVAQDYIVTPIDGSHTSYLFRAGPASPSRDFSQTAAQLPWGAEGMTVTACSSSPTRPASVQQVSPSPKEVVIVEHQRPQPETPSKPAPAVSRDSFETAAPRRSGQTVAVQQASAVSKQATVMRPSYPENTTAVSDSRGVAAPIPVVQRSVELRDRAEAGVPHVTIVPAGPRYRPSVVELPASASGASFKTHVGVAQNQPQRVSKVETAEQERWSGTDGCGRGAGEEHRPVYEVSRAASGGFSGRQRQHPTTVLVPQRSLPLFRAPERRAVTPRVTVVEPLFEGPTAAMQQAILVPLACPNVPIFSARRRRSLSPFRFRGNPCASG